jgi:hypothetical protein
MAEQNDRTNRDKAEGDRSTAGQGTRNETGAEPAERYDRTGDEGSGITNRPLDVEIENQDALPQRGQSKDEDPDRTSDSDRGPDR